MPTKEVVGCLLLNSLTLVGGFILLITASIYATNNDYIRDIYSQFYIISVLSLAVAVLIIILASGLIIWILKQWPILTTIFSIILLVIVLFIIVGAIALLIIRKQLETAITNETIAVYNNYKNSSGSENSTEVLERVQQLFECCGLQSPLDWTNGTTDGKNIPDSCCVVMSTNCAKDALITKMGIYFDGCVEAVHNYFRPIYRTLLGMLFAIAIISIFASVINLYLRRFMRKRYDSL